MNGRVQDPYTGRFVSADPTVPDPSYSQAFNRFAYVYNNPMNATDPSGFNGCGGGNNPHGFTSPSCTDMPLPSGNPLALCFGNARCADVTPNEAPTQKIGNSAGTSPVPDTEVTTTAPAPAGLAPITPSEPISQSDLQSAGAPGGFSQGGHDYDRNGNDTTTGDPCDCSVNTHPGYESFGDSLNNTCLGCDVQTGNVDWNSAGGSLKYMGVSNNSSIARPGIAGGGGPKVGPTRNSGSLGPTIGAAHPLGYYLPNLPASVVDYTVGLADAVSFNIGRGLRNGLDIGSSQVNQNSGAYAAGSWSALVVGVSRMAYGLAAKGVSIAASSGASASAIRASMRYWGKLGMGAELRVPNLAKYATDAELRAAAGRTNTVVNAYGVGTTATAAYNLGGGN